MFSNIKFVLRIWKYGIKAALEYRISFLLQTGATILNNSIYFVFWIIFFRNIISVNSYSLNDMLMQFSIVTGSFGLAYAFFGNSSGISRIIVNGELDYYMLFPRNILLYLISSKFYISSLGDLMFSIILLAFIAKNIFVVSLWAVFVITGSIIIIMFNIILCSLTFWFGNAEYLSGIISEAMVTFSLYPNNVYKGFIKILLLTIIPSSYLGHIPLSVMQNGNYIGLALVIGFTVLISIIALCLFYRGLRKYESGNLISINM